MVPLVRKTREDGKSILTAIYATDKEHEEHSNVTEAFAAIENMGS
jgi:hypothetical protein